MSGGPPRKLPRIMARVKQKQDLTVHTSDVRRMGDVHTKLEKQRNIDANSDALSHELSREKLVVRDGLVVAVQQIQHGGIVNGILGASTSSGGRRVVIDTTATQVMPDLVVYAENPLPGVADEIESYPCKFCPDQVFLTSFGLERHARQCHREQFAEIAAFIQNIQEEWERREVERGRQRERVQMAKIRQESIAHAAIRNASLRMAQPGNEIEIGSEEVLADQGPERFEACRICNLLVNARHPTAMENHLRAHKKNDELRSQMLAEYGAEIVGKLTCHECHLVFTDENKLMVHFEHTHVRRRKFVCKWCGHLCSSMTDLNMHKSDVHAMPASQSRADRTAMARHNMRKAAHQQGMGSQHRPPPSQATLGAASSYRTGMMRRERGGEDIVCRTSCDECGLHLVRPSLLIRHMLRVHSKEAFSCEVVTSGVPPFKIEVDRGRITWSCCETKFSDRHDFLLHRRQDHLERLALSMNSAGHDIPKEPDTISNTDRILQMTSANLPLQPGTAAYTGRIVQAEDGSMQVVLPDGVDTSGEIFVVMIDDQENDDKAQIEYLHQQPGPSNQHENDHQDQIHLQVPIDGDDTMTLTQEQYDQLHAQYGEDLSNMQIMFVNEDEMDNHQLLEEEHHEHHLSDSQSQSVDDHHHDMMHHQQQKELNESQRSEAVAGTALMHQQPELTNEELFEP